MFGKIRNENTLFYIIKIRFLSNSIPKTNDQLCKHFLFKLLVFPLDMLFSKFKQFEPVEFNKFEFFINFPFRSPKSINPFLSHLA